MKKIFVLGASGQDGSFMSDILVENPSNKVFGICRKGTDEIKFINNKVNYLKIDYGEIEKVIEQYKPDEIFNFMGYTNVFEPFEKISDVFSLNFDYPFRIINYLKNNLKDTKFFQASSCLVFGLSESTLQDEQTFRNPIYPYGISKNFTDEIIKMYRKQFGLKLYSFIFYPHESERRKEGFFSQKIIRESIEIKMGIRKNIELSNPYIIRNLGYAKDYMYACLKISENKPDDFIIGSEYNVSNYEFVENVFSKLNLRIDEHLSVTNNTSRNQNLNHLKPNTKKINNLGWKTKTNIEQIIDYMIEYNKKEFNL